MKVSELQEAKYDYSLSDYQAVPYDTPEYKKIFHRPHSQNPHIGPQEGKYLNLMLKKIKPAALLKLEADKKLFEPYIKDGTFVLAAKSNRGWVVTLPGEEWRGPKLLSLFDDLTGQNTAKEKRIHAKIGILLGLPRESIRHFISKRPK